MTSCRLFEIISFIFDPYVARNLLELTLDGQVYRVSDFCDRVLTAS